MKKYRVNLNGTAYEVEFVDSEGDTIDVLTTPADMIVLVDHR